MPTEAAMPGKKVIILGAGLAGLAAAYELREMGYEVVVIEARARPGGRVYTLRDPFSDGLYAEAGATWVLSSHDHTLRYLKLFNIPLDPLPTAGMDLMYHAQGITMTAAQMQRSLDVFGVRPDECALGLGGLFARYVGATLARASSIDSICVLDAFDKMTFANFLRNQGASEQAIALMRLGNFDLMGDGPEEVSATHLLRDVALMQGRTLTYAIRGGTDRLPRAFASRLKENLIYRAVVKRIHRSAEMASVTIERDGALEVIEGDYIVCTLPFSVLKIVEIDPPFSENKQKSIAELLYTAVTRIYLQTTKRYWKTDGLSKMFVSDLPIRTVRDATINQPGNRGILEAYIAGPHARRVTAMTKQERLDFVLTQIETLLPGISENLEISAEFSWHTDPWSLGAYMWFRPGQLESVVAQTSSPEGRIHFAGDHTSHWPGWMQGALQSGNRAALEISRTALG